MKITVNEKGEIPLTALIELWPVLAAAAYYRCFIKDKTVVLKFYNSKKRLIKLEAAK